MHPHHSANNLWVLLLLAFVLTAGLAVHKVIAANPPTLKAGTYLQGQTLSVWPSWTVLGNALGEALPTDPLNQLGPAGTCATSTNLFCIDKSQCPNGENCILHDPATGWSTENRRFSFACATSSYAYRYIDISTSTYEVRARLENLGFTVSNWQQFADSFVSSSIVKFYPDMGICSGNPEVSTLSAGKCGDGIINASNNEQCDPPGKLRYGACGASHSNQIKLDVCNSSCQWTPSSTPYVSCSYVSKCGNGIIEAGETCDDGALNGKYNHCNSTCSGKSATYCGDHIVQSTYELCDPGTAADFYAPNRKDSCSWDCQHYGPYCGDGVIQNNEACDGTKSCEKNGVTGMMQCNSQCKFSQTNAIAWWPFESINSNTFADASGRNNTAACQSPNCPSISTNAKIGKDLSFNGSTSLVTAHFSHLGPNFSISMWAKFNNVAPPLENQLFYLTRTGHRDRYAYLSTYLGGWHFGTAADMENVSWQTGEPAAVGAPLANIWYHVAYVFGSGVGTMYIDGVKMTDMVSRSTAGPVIANADDLTLYIGGTPEGYQHMTGYIDEVKVYDHALTDTEIAADYTGTETGYCSTTLAVPPAAPGTCGDGVVDQGESCDKGTANNGKVCIPTYGKTCSYCSVDCQHTIDVQPKEYCGDGKVEGTEVCDTDLSSGKIYVSEVLKNPTSTETDISQDHNGYLVKSCVDELQDPNTLKKGTKVCTPDCKAVKLTTGEDNCVKCGIDMVNGALVEGSIINTLDPLSANPLLASTVNNQAGTIDLYLRRKAAGKPDVHVDAFCRNVSEMTQDYTFTGNPNSMGWCNGPTASQITLNSNPMCSAGDNTSSYNLEFNADWAHLHPFNVVGKPQPGQYDLVLSPTILQSVRPKDLRMVVSWVGNNDFYSGFFIPKSSTDYFLMFGSTFPKLATGTYYYQRQCAQTGTFSFCPILDLIQQSGIWYHGFNRTPDGTSEESYTIDTGAMRSGQYVFYIKSESGPIKTLAASSKLKVDLYFPEGTDRMDPAYSYRHFALPVQTYYLNAALPSDNPSAEYWQVFNIVQPDGAVVSTTDIYAPNKLVTDPKYFEYRPPCLDRNGDPYPAGSQHLCRPAVGDCDQAEYCDGNPSGECPGDVKKGRGAICNASLSNSCYNPAAVCDGTSDVCPAPTLAPAGTVCGATDDFCLNPPTCDGSTYSCPNNATSKADGTPCDDNTICNGREACHGGSCTAGTALSCNSNNQCVQDSCNSSSGCQQTIRWGGSCTASGGVAGTCVWHLSGGLPVICQASCIPTICAAQGKNCGSISDGCGGTLSCGSCSGSQTCSNNVCTCVPTTCVAQGKNCGNIPDGCGGTLSCGMCSNPLTCWLRPPATGGNVCNSNWPSVTAITPTTGKNPATLTVTGMDYWDTQVIGGCTSQVYFGATPATVVSWSNSSIVVVIPVLPAGANTYVWVNRCNQYSQSVNSVSNTNIRFIAQ